MKNNFKHTLAIVEKEVRPLLEGKSIFEMTVWVRDHAQFLKWFCNYNSEKIDKIMESLLCLSQCLSENHRDNPDVIKDFRDLCIYCTAELEANCK